MYIYGIIFKNNTTFCCILLYLWYNFRYIDNINGIILDIL